MNLNENLTSEHGEEIELEAECDNELGSDDLNPDETVNSIVKWAYSSSSFNLTSFNLESTSLTPSSIESSPSLELKTLPKHLKYTYLGEQ